MKIAAVLLRSTEIALFSMLFLIVYSPIAHAQSSTIAQSFKIRAQDDITSGALVSTRESQDTLELATLDSINRLVGVVDNDPLVSLSGGSTQEAEVVLSGTAKVLVSDINGAIKSGDRVTVSPIAGVGMKAAASGQVIGTAQDNFKMIANKTITDRSGKSHDTQLGYVQVQIGITTYQAPGSDYLPPFIQNTANGIAGQPVSLLRVLICSILILLGFVTAVTLVYTSIRSSITSLGRNPLAAPAIRRGLYQASVISLLVIGGALLAGYLTLTL